MEKKESHKTWNWRTAAGRVHVRYVLDSSEIDTFVVAEQCAPNKT